MMILDLDIGNTRVKWLLRHGNDAAPQRGVCDNAEELVALLEERAILPSRVRVSCVAASAAMQLIDAWLLERGLPALEQAVSVSHAAGVNCGYDLPEQMGVDRWLAVCAAWHRVGRPCVVADAGSALTIDFIDSEANHLGGYIVPGLSMQQASLLEATENVRFRAARQPISTGPGTNTAQAVHRGVIRMLAALIEAAVNDFGSELGSEIDLLLTGGDGPSIGRVLGIEYAEAPDLVLEGIELVMGRVEPGNVET